MSSAAPVNDPADRAVQRDEDAQCFRQMLHELAEMGMGIARVHHRQATAESAASKGQPAAPAVASKLTIAASAAFDRIARTVRRTIALARKLSEPDRAPAPTRCAADSARRRRLSARAQTGHAAEDTIEREADGPEAEALDVESRERPEGPDYDSDDLDPDDDLDEQAVADLIAALSRNPGLAALSDAQLWQRRAPNDVRDRRTQAARPGTGQPEAAQPIAQALCPPAPVAAAPPATLARHAPPPGTRTSAWPGTDPPPA